MPNAAPKICNHVGCFKLTDPNAQAGSSGEKYCPNHLGNDVARKRAESKRYDRFRGTASARGFNYQWRMRSKVYLTDHPVCENPFEIPFHLVPAAEVHHKSGGQTAGPTMTRI
jgi:hypothetical protein